MPKHAMDGRRKVNVTFPSKIWNRLGVGGAVAWGEHGRSIIVHRKGLIAEIGYSGFISMSRQLIAYGFRSTARHKNGRLEYSCIGFSRSMSAEDLSRMRPRPPIMDFGYQTRDQLTLIDKNVEAGALEPLPEDDPRDLIAEWALVQFWNATQWNATQLRDSVTPLTQLRHWPQNANATVSSQLTHRACPLASVVIR